MENDLIIDLIKSKFSDCKLTNNDDTISVHYCDYTITLQNMDISIECTEKMDHHIELNDENFKLFFETLFNLAGFRVYYYEKNLTIYTRFYGDNVLKNKFETKTTVFRAFCLANNIFTRFLTELKN